MQRGLQRHMGRPSTTRRRRPLHPPMPASRPCTAATTCSRARSRPRIPTTQPGGSPLLARPRRRRPGCPQAQPHTTAQPPAAPHRPAAMAAAALLPPGRRSAGSCGLVQVTALRQCKHLQPTHRPRCCRKARKLSYWSWSGRSCAQEHCCPVQGVAMPCCACSL